MADKEATVYIVDVGASMKSKRHGRAMSDLEWGMKYVWDKITSTVATERKTLTLGVVGLRTDETDNELMQQDGFENLTVFLPIGQLLLPGLRSLERKIRPSGAIEGDAISAIVLAITMITNYCKKLKYIRRIILVTDGRGNVDPDGIADIAGKLLEEGIALTVMYYQVGIDFDDSEFGFKEEDKDERKENNEHSLRQLVESSNGIFGTMQQAIDELQNPRLKLTRPVPTFKGDLTLGDASKYDSALSINVERYPRVMVRRPMTARNILASTAQGSEPSFEELAKMDEAANIAKNGTIGDENPNARHYYVEDENVEGGKREVERDDLAKGYEYGRTIVPISELEFDVTKLETDPGLQMMGFVPWSTYDRFMSMTVSSIIIAQKANAKAAIALSSLIHALYELESYAVARLVGKSDKEPVVCLLAPEVTIDYECLLEVEIPFAEDVRAYKFPPLDRIITVSGKKVTEHRNLPSEELLAKMSDYLDDMDLSELATDEEGVQTEYMQISETFSPVLHRIEHAVRQRAVDQEGNLPPVSDVLTQYSHPPQSLTSSSATSLKHLVAVANVKRVPEQKLSRKRQRDEIKPLSGLDVEAILRPRSRNVQISAQNAIPDFKHSLDNSTGPEDIKEASRQLGEIIFKDIEESFANIAYERALEKIRTMRQEMIEVEEPDVYNSFIRELKIKIFDESLGGNRIEMWDLVRRMRLGLISKSMSAFSSVEEEEAHGFMAVTSS